MRKMNWRIWKNIKLPRGKFLKRLDWYIIKKFLGTYVFAIALIISIAVVFDFNEKMDRFMSHEAPWNAIVFDYYLNFIPYFANLFSPLFVFIAVIFFTSKLAENSEIIAMFSTGMSFKRMLRPYINSITRFHRRIDTVDKLHIISLPNRKLLATTQFIH